MANYLFLFRGGQMRTMSPQELQQSMGRWRAWIGELSSKGQYKGGEPLAEGGRILNGKKQTVTDGPFGETKDVVTGYLLITAGDMQAATEAARGCPIFEREGSVEVRELREM